jgi:O-acetyl-ADP-ribose deacetylase (regulator of RNase III)
MKVSSSLVYVKGDATRPAAPGFKIIAHICNNQGKWGKGFVLSISKRWKEPERQYRIWFAQTPHPRLGEVQFVNVESDTVIANIIGQHGVRRRATGAPPIRYDAVEEGLKKIALFAIEHRASVHMPRIGTGLAGGSWEKVEPIISRTLVDSGVDVLFMTCRPLSRPRRENIGASPDLILPATLPSVQSPRRE